MKIKEVEKMLQMNAQTIRYYDKLGFLNPQRDENGYRNYTKDDIKILKKIRFLRELDISLDMIERILNNQDEFQKVLQQHIKTLQAQVENLEEIQQRCVELNQKKVPLLDAVVDGKFQNISVEIKQVKSIFQKTIEFLKPYPVITIGRKTTPFQMIAEMFICFVIVAFLNISFCLYLQNNGYINNIHWGTLMPTTIIFWIGLIFTVFREKYYEFGDVDFCIFDSYKMKLKSMRAVLNNTTNQLARHYRYNDIKNVKVIVEKKTGGIGYGPVTYYNILYTFQMFDGNCFEINSSLYNEIDQDRKSVYEILEYHHVNIIDHKNLKKAFSQNELSLYQYLEQNC